MSIQTRGEGIYLADDEALGRKGTARRRYGGQGNKNGFPVGWVISGATLLSVLALWWWSENP